MLSNILYIVPKKALSHLVGALVHITLPDPLRMWSLRFFVWMYNINLDEAQKPLSEYKSIGDLFIRHLKPSARPLAEGPIVHPADSVISQIGQIQDNKCIQAKGRKYSVEDLLANEQRSGLYKQGLFATYYLCPTDYHRVHSPVDGEIVAVTHIPGALWPVNQWSVNNIDQLFAINERVVVHINSRLGPVEVVFVGATNVGKISLAFDSELISNQGHMHVRKKEYAKPISVGKGDELGVFHMGSTIVMLMNESIYNQSADWSQWINRPVKVRAGLL